jgi:hypothetical protein
MRAGKCGVEAPLCCARLMRERESVGLNQRVAEYINNGEHCVNY